MKLPIWSGLALLSLALLVEPAWADIRPPDFPRDGARHWGSTLATIVAGLAVTAALVAAGFWLARRGAQPDTTQPIVAQQQPDPSAP